MDKLLIFVEKHKYGITFAVLVHLFWFVGLNLYKVSNPVEMPERRIVMEIEADDYEIELTPEQIEALYANSDSQGDLKNIVKDQNDDRETSMDDYSQSSSSNKSARERVEEYERQAFKDQEAKRKASGEKILKGYDEEVKIYGGDEGEESKSSGSTSDNAYGGKTVLTYDLKGRKPKDNNDWNIRNPGYRCKGSGKVVVIIIVNKYGEVKDAKLDVSSSSNYSDCMVQNAVKYAKLSKFDFKENAPAMQTGRIYYNFIAQ